MPPKSSGVAKQRTSRRKIALACDPCREKKIRCDGGKPICGSCDRKSWGIAQCSYSMDNPRTASQDEYIRVLRSRINNSRIYVFVPECQHRKYAGTHHTRKTLLHMKLYIWIGIGMGSRGLQGSPKYHESPNTQYRISDFTLPPRSLADHLLKCFWDRVACIYPFFDRPSFEKAYDNLWRSEREGMNKLPDMHIGLGGKSDSSPKSIVFYCALNVMFALGCHFSDLPLQEREATAHSFFLRCKRFVGLDLLEIHTVGVVQTLLIVALYLQSSPYPSRCWNAIGIACRLAQGLGLHEAHNVSSMTVLETEVRRRTWHGCVMLDVFVSMTHGRPSMTSHLAPIPLPYATGEDVPLTMGFYVATIKLYRILDRILSDVYNMWRGRMNEESKRSTRWSEGNFDSLLELERQLQYFKSNLPPYLSWSASSRPEYYYIRLLLYRPIFTQKDIYPAWKDAESSLQSCIVKKCAATCVSTATELIHLIYETYSTSYTDAWWYNGFYTSTCALVLIMAHSVPSLSDSIDFSKVREAWEKCENILAHMATFSQSARTSLRFLQAAFSQNIHGRPSSKPSSNVGVNPDRNLTDEASAHYPVPDGPTNPSPFQDTPGLDSSYWTDSGIGPSTFEDDLGLLSWIDVPDMWQWLRAES
nr:fungal specific transcription factor [Aspergillus niger CBS 513.88]|eukprot:XP_001389538.2 fungal specific transcription factor [Aspergillus niger CBS 513.88]